ncbi:MAG: HNH endonuclease domain-containing protein [Prevotella sp.]|nr:HNH endonuclease domain-containing protein [Prevotella sp.]
MKRILGIDTGTNSLGWAVVDKNETGEYSLVRKGSLIFQEGVKIEKGIESSKASERTGHKSSRKHYFRRRLRKIEVLKVLVKYGWCPPLSAEALHQWHVKKQYPLDDAFLSWQRTDEKFGRNPYYFRHVCLHEKLDFYEESDRYVLGRAMYHLAQRRGFLSNRLDQSDDKESGKVKDSISELSDEMKKAGCEFLGDYFYKLYSERGVTVRIRNRYTDREEHYKKEFYEICKIQGFDEQQIRDLERALYFQRPLKSQRQGVGRCTMEPSRPRCADSHPAYERFRMLSFINNIKVKGPHDIDLRPLNEEELKKINGLFFRKSKPQFDFEDIAKAIAGKKNYQYIKDKGDLPYKFNYRMSQGVTGCPTTASLIDIFGEDYAYGLAEQYTLSAGKTKDQMTDDVWNVLYSFADKEKVKAWGMDKLQLDEETADKFSKIRLSHSFASLSLCAIRKILPWLEAGMIYSHAVMMAKVPDIVGRHIWSQFSDTIVNELSELIANFNPKDESMQGTLDFCIKDYLRNNFDLNPGVADKLYHPSMIETYPDAVTNKDGVYQLGSPRTNAVRNPMAMRSLHQLRKVINMLLREGIIDQNTEVHIEYARELNDSNKRQAIARWNKEREKARAGYAADILKLYKDETGKDIVPTDVDILKFQLWEEQGHVCLYTGEQIGLADFIGPNPKYDIEHTVPRSVGGDSTLENMTLCSSRFNRDVKKAQLPSELSNHDEIMARLDKWKEKIEELRKAADKVRTHSSMEKDMKDALIQKRHRIRLELDYWEGKYRRFQMTEVPEGFSRRQGAGIGLVGKYAGLYLKSLFHRKDDRTKSNVRVVKGATTAEYRKMWGIQDEYEKKSRDNHIHHCIDAIVIACISPGEYNETARYYQQYEEYERGRANKPQFKKPWPTFTEDIKALGKELLVVHDTPDNMPKQSRKKVKTPKGIIYQQGDTARGSLHSDTYYGAIEKDGEIRYVVRRALSSLKEADIDNIVDDKVKEIIKAAVDKKGFKLAFEEGIYMNESKKILIKKVRCYYKAKEPLHIRNHRDKSDKEYKRRFHVETDGNYCFAIYEGIVKGKIKRTFDVVNMLDAARYYRRSSDIRHSYPISAEVKNGLRYRCLLKTGTMLILLQSYDEEIDVSNSVLVSKRLYYVAIMNKDGRIILRHHQEAREATILKKERNAGAFNDSDAYRSEISMSMSNFNALVEGYDFEINALGEIILKNN